MKIKEVWFDKNYLFVQLDSNHIIGNPLKWFSRLLNASEDQRSHFEIGPFGESIHWEEIDEDLSLESLFDFKKELDYGKI